MQLQACDTGLFGNYGTFIGPTAAHLSPEAASDGEWTKACGQRILPTDIDWGGRPADSERRRQPTRDPTKCGGEFRYLPGCSQMRLSPDHIQSLDLPNVKIAYLEIAQHLAPALMPLLLAELSLANHIYEAGVDSLDLKDPSTGFLSLSRVLNEGDLSKANDLWVYLVEPFKGTYKPSKGVVYAKGEYGAPHDGNAPDKYRTTGSVSHSLLAPLP
jgi:hypothetical protein